MVVEFEGLRLDVERRRLVDVRSGTPLALTPRVLETLIYLVERRGRLIGKDELLGALWPKVVVEENSLERCISMLRRALGERAGDNRFIVTEPGRGYRFVAAVTEVPDSARDVAPPPLPVPTGPRSRQMVALAIAATLLVGGISAAVWVMQRGTHERAPPARGDASAPSRDPRAEHLVTRASEIRSQGATEHDFRSAIELYDQALALDPRFARAWSDRAGANYQLVAFRLAGADAMRAAEHDARRALELDPQLATARAALASVYSLQGRWLAADDILTRGLEHDRDHGMLIGTRAYLRAQLGQLRAALADAETTMRLGPLDPVPVGIHSIVSSALGMDQTVMRDLRFLESLGVSSSPLGAPQAVAEVRAGNFARAAELAARGMPLALATAGGTDIVRRSYLALGDASLRPRAIAEVRALLARQPLGHTGGAAWGIAQLAALGDLEGAFAVANRLLDEGAADRFTGMGWNVLWRPDMAPLRHDVRFTALVKRLGMPEYWAARGAPDGCDLLEETLRCR